MKRLATLISILILSTGFVASAKSPQKNTTVQLSRHNIDATLAPTTTTSTTIATTTTTSLPSLPFTPRCPNIVQIARAVGWPDIELPMVDRLAYRESRCDIDWSTGLPRCAHNPTDPSGGSWGAMQINQSWVVKNRWNPHPAGFLGALGIANGPGDLCSWETNLRAAKALYDYSLNRHGWEHRFRPWYPLPTN